MVEKFSRQRLSAWMKVLILVSAVSGIAIQAGALTGTWQWSSFQMFTTLSNVLTAAYCLFSLLSRGRSAAFEAVFQFTVILCMSLTGLVAAFLLSGMFVRASQNMRLALFLLHDVVPIAVVLDWLLFSEKGRFCRWYPLAGMVPPFCYMTYALIGGMTGHGLGMDGSQYPYPFLDVDQLGGAAVALNCCVLGGLLYLFGRLLVWLDGRMAARKN